MDLLEILSLFPVPEQALRTAAANVERVVIAEENEFGLYAGELRPRLPGVEIHQVNGIGAMLTPAAIRKAVLA